MNLGTFLRGFLLIVLASPSVFAQTGTVYGFVRDQETGESLLGANILLVGTSFGASTDLDGRYQIKNVAPGTYNLRISFVGYTAKTVSGAVVKAGESLKMDVNLSSETVQAEEVVVTAQRMISTESAVLAARKSSATIGDGISMEQIKRSPDATSGDALKRVTGISVVDDKFVFVRGVTDRYNGAMLNGVSVTSTDTDVDKRSFTFDLIPANLLENMNVVKSSTPDLPGDFTGGLVQMNTLDFPQERTFKVSLGTAYNDLANLQSVQRSQGGGTDWLGFDDGSREFPSELVDIPYGLSQVLPNSWAQKTTRSPLNLNASISLGDQLQIGDGVLGYVGALSYRNGFTGREITSNYFRTGSRIIEGTGARDMYGVLWGGLLNLTYKPSDFDKFAFRNSYNQRGEDKATLNTFVDENNNRKRVQITEWDQRSTYAGQVSGDHVLPGLGAMEILWRGAYSQSISTEPDRKTMIYTRDAAAVDPAPYSMEFSDRSWADLSEYARSAGVDFTLPFGAAKLKFGGLYDSKNRAYKIRFYQVDGRNVRDNRGILPPDQIFVPENFSSNGGYFMLELSSPRDEYTSRELLGAAYLMTDFRFGVFEQQFRLAGGVRLEDYDHKVNTIDPAKPVGAADAAFVASVENTDFLPSLVMTYLLNDITNIRLAYNHSVNRPEARELAAFYFYDYNIYEGTFGNPELNRALSRNYDARVEVFPGVGEVFAVSYFYKSIRDAIEQKILPSSNPERTWFNSPKGTNRGWEFELRKSFDFLGGYFSNFAITGNYTIISSDIEYSQGYKVPVGIDSVTGGIIYGDEFRNETREMQGQSPYIVNVSFTFREPSLRTAISFSYNEFGERLDAVGDERFLDILQEKRGIFDVSVIQPVGDRLELKFSARDLFAQTQKYRTREGNPYREIVTGTFYSFQVSANL